MIAYEIYKVIHILAVISLFLSLGGYAILSITKSTAGKGLVGRTHGIAVLLILVAGFGLVARLGAQMLSLWILTKLGVLVALAMMPVFIRRNPERAPALWLITIALGGLAIYMAVYKVNF
ncbi:MAG: hypothetical protein ACT4NX_10210 [Deltaproteobacteria bacterium]